MTTTTFKTIQDLYQAMKAGDPATMDQHGDAYRTDLPVFDGLGDDDAPPDRWNRLELESHPLHRRGLRRRSPADRAR